jgi:hypothetical protein
MCEPLEQICDGQASPLIHIIPGVEWLEIGRVELGKLILIEHNDWSFSALIAVETLSLSMGLVPLIMPMLADEVQVVPEILPALRDLILHGSRSFLESFLQDVVGPFVAARQVLGNPVVVDLWY